MVGKRALLGWAAPIPAHAVGFTSGLHASQYYSLRHSSSFDPVLFSSVPAIGDFLIRAHADRPRVLRNPLHLGKETGERRAAAAACESGTSSGAFRESFIRSAVPQRGNEYLKVG